MRVLFVAYIIYLNNLNLDCIMIHSEKVKPEKNVWATNAYHAIAPSLSAR